MVNGSVTKYVRLQNKRLLGREKRRLKGAKREREAGKLIFKNHFRFLFSLQIKREKTNRNCFQILPEL